VPSPAGWTEATSGARAAVSAETLRPLSVRFCRHGGRLLSAAAAGHRQPRVAPVGRARRPSHRPAAGRLFD